MIVVVALLVEQLPGAAASAVSGGGEDLLQAVASVAAADQAPTEIIHDRRVSPLMSLIVTRCFAVVGELLEHEPLGYIGVGATHMLQVQRWFLGSVIIALVLIMSSSAHA